MIEVRDLTFTYPKAPSPTLAGISFAVRPGEVFGLLGPSGAGKSTTQRIPMGLQRGYDGSALLFGTPVSGLGGALYERIGVSFELPALYLRLTALENLRFFAGLYDKPTRDPLDVLADVDLAEDAGKRVEQFSKGMKMRLNLARALLHDPELLFLDEPTTGQDPARARMTRDLIRALKARGKTIFLTTHNMAEAEEVCDRVAFLVHGKIAVAGRPGELRSSFGERILDAKVTGDTGETALSFPMDGLADNEEFLRVLRAGRITSLHTREASLDDVFIRTARPPKDEAP